MAPLIKPTSIGFRESLAETEAPDPGSLRLPRAPRHRRRFPIALVTLGVFGWIALYSSQAQVAADASAVGQPAISSSLSPGAPVLPSRLATVSQVVVSGSQLALDSNGTLFRSDDHGEHWHQVRQQWMGKAVELIGIPPLSAAPKSGQAPKSSEDSTIYAAVLLRSTPELRWLSVDRGKTWRPANSEEPHPVKWSGE